MTSRTTRRTLDANRRVPEVVHSAGVRDGRGRPELASAAVAPTQIRLPSRSTVRTVVQAVIGFAPIAPEVYHAATQHDPAAAGGAAAAGLAICAGVTRVMANPSVEAFLRRYKALAWLAAAPGPPS